MKLKEYLQRKNWAFSNLFTSECPKCKKGRVRYIGDDWTGHTWISVYECNKCKTEFM